MEASWLLSGSDLDEYWTHLVIATIIALSGFYKGFQKLKRARWLENLPTSRVRSASQGFVELEGTCEAPATGMLVAPLSGNQCVWYQYRVERRGDKNWRTVKSGRSKQAFLLRDDTGLCEIDPIEATVLSTNVQSWYGGTEWPLPGIFADALLNNRYRYTEERLHIEDHLVVLGEFKTLRRAAGTNNPPELVNTIRRPAERSLPFLISNQRQNNLIKKLRRGGWGSILIFFVAGAYAVFLISLRYF